MARHWLAGRLTNQWVIHRGHDNGLGLCTAVYEDNADVAYYAVVGEAPDVKTLPVDELRRPNSYTGYRAWVPNRDFGFRSALIERHDGKNFVLRMSSGIPESRPPHSVVIRRNEPLTRVLKAVQAGAVDDPTLYLARHEFLAELVLQAAACHGYDSVPSAAIDLYDHQLETLQRVLEDPVPRYVLADEVGLGKTIEAALIIRQTLQDDASAYVYVSTPSVLEDQWRSELADKFLLGNFLESNQQLYPRILIRPHKELMTQPEAANGARFLVIDEAHQLIQASLSSKKWHVIEEVAHRAQGLLLLSATPMRGDFEILEGLLHLIDPAAFPLRQGQHFIDRVEERTAELVDVDVLTSRFSTAADRSAALKRILERHPGDPYVEKTANPEQSESDIIADTAPRLKNYLRETFRISRRMIRHRRGVGPAADFPTTGRRAVLIPVSHDVASEIIDDFLDAYRARIQVLPRADAMKLFWRAVSHGLAGPGPLVKFLEARLVEVSQSVPSRDVASERSLLEQARAQLLLAPDKRSRTAVNVACRRVKAGQRIVAISEYSSEAENFARLAQDQLGDGYQVLRHTSNLAASTREWMIADFLTTCSGGLLVGDSSLEEGRNLQGSHALLNLDLPLSPNRLEQRIGRLDRYAGASALPNIDSVPDILVLRAEGSIWSSAYVNLLGEGIGVFTESASTVQRFLATWETRTKERLLDEGAAALSKGLVELRAEIDDEKLQVDELEEWESDPGSDYGNALTTELLSAYEDRAWKLESALTRLTSDAGGLPFEVERTRGGEAFRFKLKDIPAYLVPPDLDPRVEELLGRDHSIERLSSLTASFVTPMRIGDPLVDWLHEYLLTDERGRAFALITADESVVAWDFWLRLDYLVEFGDYVLDQSPERDRRRLRRRGDAFIAPRMFELWANADSVAGADLSRHLDFLLESTSREPRQSVDWRAVHEEIRGWAVECNAAERTGRAWLVASEELRAAVESGVTAATADRSRREGILSARASRLPSSDERTAAIHDLDSERMVSRSILQGVAAPSISLVSCGALIRRPR
jgi:ATP-dependent helicase HepA